MSNWKSLTCIAALGACVSLFAAEPRDYAVNVHIQARTSPPTVVLSWPADSYAREYKISRKLPHEQSWSTLAVLPGDVSSFADGNVTLGGAYEYEIEKATSHFPYPAGDPSEWVTAHTYLYAGINANLVDARGKVILVVDSSIAAPLAAELDLLQQDLTGDGWQVIRRDVGRSSSVQSVRDIIRAEYNADPANVRSVFLFGHVPVPYSGAINPDMHQGHIGAWPADVYYADINGNWTDHTVDVTTAWYEENHNRPGDGKFDQSEIPSTVELEIGRVDFFNMPSFAPRNEVQLLRDYLRKNHEFRHRAFTLPRRGLIRDNFGDISGDAPAVDAWRHYPVFFGPDSAREVEANSFFSTLQNEGFLWSYAGGGGDYKNLDGVGSTGDFAAQNPRTAFLFLHGSYFGDWNNEDNLLRAAIATPNYTLASIWSGLPHWFMHHMALGQTIGYSTRLTQNNRGQYKSNLNFSRGEVHISLLGDPTLQMFPVAPPANLRSQVGSDVVLSWDASPDNSLFGYHVYYSQNALGPYQRLTAVPTPSTSYSHSAGQGTHHYMVRAIKLEQTGSGTFFNPSQGIFLRVDKNTSGELPTVTMTIEDAGASELGPDTGSLRITRSPFSSQALTVHLSISGSAQNGVDYGQVPTSTQIPPDAGSLLIPITPLQDGLLEGDETVNLSIAASGAYTIGSPSSGSLLIKDHQPNQPPSISAIADQSIPENNSTPVLEFTVNDAETAPGDLAVDAISSNQALVPDSNIVLGGSGPNRTIQITPASGQAGSTQITITVSDGSLEGTRIFTVDVSEVNLPPAAFEQDLQTDEDTSIEIILTGNDPDGGALQFIILESPVKGTLAGTPPQLVYTPENNATGTDSFTFQISDGDLVSQEATVTIDIIPMNDLPVAHSQEIDLQEDTSAPITLAGSDPEGAALDYVVLTQPQNGTLSGTAPNLEYTPNPNAIGVDSFTFKVIDGGGESPSATVTIHVLAVNDPPVAHSTELKIEEDTPTPITLIGNDPDGNDLLFTIDKNPERGTLSGTPPTLTYTPDKNFNGDDSFTFRVSDGESSSPAATVNIEISPVNDLPVAFPQSMETQEDTPIAIVLTGRDPETPALEYSIVTPPEKGTLSKPPPFTGYTPRPNASGVDTFTFQVSDGEFTSAPETVTITIHPVNDPPVANSQSLELNENSAADILLSASDPDDTSLTFTIIDGPANGTLSGTGPNFTYTPDADFYGDDSFAFAATDGDLESTPATVTLSILAVDQPPVATPQSVTVLEDSQLAIRLAAQDPDSPALTFSVSSPPQHGTLSGTAPELVYLPNPEFAGADSFSFVVSDESATSDPALITIEVIPENDPPTMEMISALAIRKNTSTGPISVSLNDVDSEISRLVLLVTSQSPALITTTNVFLSGSGANRTLSVTPLPNATGTAVIKLDVTDGQASTSTTLELTITNTPPKAGDDEYIASGESLAIDAGELLSNDTDPDQDPLTVIAVSAESGEGGSVRLEDGAITYISPGGEAIIDRFTYTIQDSSGATASGQVVLLPATKPRFTTIEKLSDAVVLRFRAAPGQTLRVSASSDTRSWEELGEVVTDDAGVGEFMDSEPVASLRFYRIEQD